jgi:hypothetical protein
MEAVMGDEKRVRVGRSRWAAVGAAVAVAAGATGIGMNAHADSVTGGSWVAIAPCRLFDTRASSTVGDRNTPLVANETFTRQVWGTNGACTIPTTATGISFNLTIPSSTFDGFLTLFPADAAKPNASVINPVANGGAKANGGVVGLSSTGAIKLFSNNGPVDALLDITGYFVNGGGGLGVTGPAGPAGAAGPAGSQGPVGPPGGTGAPGTPGAPGAPGTPGAPGAPGGTGPGGPAGVGLDRPPQATTVANSAGILQDSAAVIGADGLAIAAAYNASNSSLQVVHCDNVACTAATVSTVDGLLNDAGNTPSIAIGSDGLPIVVDRLAPDGDLRVTHCQNVTCQAATSQTIVTADDDGIDPSLAIAPDGMPYIVARDSVTSSSLAFTQCTTLTCSASTTVVTATGLAGDGHHPTLVFGVDGLPWIAHDNAAFGLRLSRCATITCSSLASTITVDPTPSSIGNPTITLGVDGFPILATGIGVIGLGDLHVMHCGDSTCSTHPVIVADSAGVSGIAPSIAIGSDGLPVIAHRANSITFDLRVTHCSDIACTKSTTVIANTGPASPGGSASMLIGVDGNPLVAHIGDLDDDVLITHCVNRFCLPNVHVP